MYAHSHASACCLLLVCQLIGFIVGYRAQSFWLTFLWCVGGLVVATLVCVPDWPFYSRHPLAWQAAVVLPGSTDSAGPLGKAGLTGSDGGDARVHDGSHTGAAMARQVGCTVVS